MSICSENGPVPQSAGLPASARRQASGLCYIFIRCGVAPGMAICPGNQLVGQVANPSYISIRRGGKSA
jgi:hypothetical protein